MSDGQYFWPMLRPASSYIRVAEAIEQGRTGPGPMSARLAQRLGTHQSEVFLTVSGTEALHLAAKVARAMIDRRHKVPSAFVPAFGIPCIWTTFAREFFSEAIDIESNGLISKRTLHEAAARSRPPHVVLAVWQGGLGGALLDGAHEWTIAHDCIYVEDMACAIGHVPKQMGIYSFSAPKLHSAGQGGAVVLNKTWPRYEEARGLLLELLQVTAGNGYKFRVTGRVEAPPRFTVDPVSNRRLSDVSCALMLDELDADGIKTARMWRAQDAIRDAVPANVPCIIGPLHNVIFPRNVDLFLMQARRRGIATARPYSHARDQGYGIRCLRGEADYKTPGADMWAAGAVYLPFGPGLGDVEDYRAAHTLQGIVDLVKLADIEAEAA